MNTLSKKISVSFFIFLSLFVSIAYVEAEEDYEPKGFIDLNFYPYDSNYYTGMTTNIFTTLPNGFSYFSLTNFTNDSGSENRKGTDVFYTEQNLMWNLPNKLPFQLITQLNLRSGDKNDRFYKQ